MPTPREQGHTSEPDFAGEGLLDGLAGDAREQRLALLRHLAAQGIPMEDLKRFSADGTLIFVPAERVIGGHARYTFDEVAQKSGIPAGFLHRLRRAMGFPLVEPEERAFTDSDVEASRMAAQALASGITEEEVLDVTRVLGRGLAPAAELMRTITLRLVLEPGLTEAELAERFGAATQALGPMTTPLVGHLLLAHLRHMARSEAISAAERTGGRLPGSREVTVCFADLVGFTRVGEEVPPDELGRLADQLDRMAADVVVPPVRLVKTIGDAAMLVADETQPLLECALRLVEEADARGEGFPQLRAGAARGSALPRAGDWYGQPVNLASRITSVARPGSVLTSGEVRDAAGDAFVWSFAGERRLKGVSRPQRLFRARRGDADGDEDPSRRRAGARRRDGRHAARPRGKRGPRDRG